MPNQPAIQQNPYKIIRTLLRIKTNRAKIPNDLLYCTSVKLVGKLKNRSKWRSLHQEDQHNPLRDIYFTKHGKVTDREATYGYFIIKGNIIHLHPALQAKAIVISYITYIPTPELNPEPTTIANSKKQKQLIKLLKESQMALKTIYKELINLYPFQ